MPDYVFGQQLHGPHTIPFTVEALRGAAEAIRSSSQELKCSSDKPVIELLDATRDVRGIFYSLDGF